MTIRANVPAGTGTVYLTGNAPALGPWDPARCPMAGRGGERTVTLDLPAGSRFEFKLTLGSWQREALTHGGTVPPNHCVVVDGDREVAVEVVDFKKDPRAFMADRQGSGVLGTLEYWQDLPSRYLVRPRHVAIWLPPSYAGSPQARYPVLYMHDGQNLFDPRMASTGVDWGVDEAIVRAVAAGRMPEVVVVGVFSTEERLAEYSPWHRGPAYARFLIEELMPRIDAAWRTLTGPAHTAVMGSSMGALISFDLCRRHSDVFGRGGCLSTHFPFSDAALSAALASDAGPLIERDLALGLRFPRGPRLYFDYGTAGIDAGYAPLHDKVAAWLQREGHRPGEDFVVRRFEGAGHTEAAWRARLDAPFAFLYGAR